MTMITLRQLLDHAAEHDYGLPAFNVNNMEQILSIVKAAKRADSPVILQASRGARKYAGDAMIRAMVEAVASMNPSIPICLHQDHGNGTATCFSAIRNGFTSVMMDGSLEADGKTPSSFEYNAEITKKVADLAHEVGASVEGELGVLGSLETGKGEAEDGHGFEGELDKSQLLTSPEDAVRFVEFTGVDALAVAVGTSHGAYKFTRKPTGDILSIETIKQIHERLPNTHIVMHGASSVDQALQDVINQFGGEMPQTYGVPVEEMVKAIRYGVRKINIDTDCRMAMTGQFRRIATEKRAEFDVRQFMNPAMKAMEAVCFARFEAFGSAGFASKIKPILIADMAARYESGELISQVRS